MKKFFTIGILLMFSGVLFSQEYKRMITENNYSVFEIQAAAKDYFEKIGQGRGTGYKSFKRWEYQALKNMDENGMLKSPQFYINELKKHNQYLNKSFSTARTTVGNWEQLGPFEWNQTSGWNPGIGRVTSLAAASGNADHMIVGGETGGVWKTLDGGANWQALTDNMPSLRVYALAIDPTNSANYYWGSVSGSIFKSTDAGATWSLLSKASNGVVNKILIDPSNTNKIYCSVEFGGLFKSVDGGVSWNLIHPEATNGYDFEFKPGNTDIVFASGNDFYISMDAGNTFNTLLASLAPWSQEYVSGTNNWSVATSNPNGSITPKSGSALGLFVNEDESSSTSRLISPKLDLSALSGFKLNFSYTNLNSQESVDTFKVLYKSSENGSWSELSSYPSQSVSWSDEVINLPNTSSSYYIAFEAASNNANSLTIDDISVVDDLGNILFENGFENAGSRFKKGPKMIGVSPADSEAVYVLEALNNGVFGALYKSTDGGTYFNKLDHTGKNYFGLSSDPEDPADLRGQAPRDMDIAIHPDDSNDVHIAGINTWRSTDGGFSFQTTSQWVPFFAENENIGYCHADIDILEFIDGKLYTGTDGGIFVAENPTVVNTNYYTDLSTGLGIRQFYKFGISQSEPVIITGGSQDNGTSVLGADGIWRDWLGADGMESFVDKNDNTNIYGTLQFGSIYKSIDGGNTINAVLAPLDANDEFKTGNWVTPLEQHPSEANTIFAGYDEVYKSTNGGETWTSISQNFGNNLDNLKLAPSNGNFQYASIGGALYRNSNINASNNWIALSGYSGSINSIAVHPTDPNKVAIATTSSQKVFVSDDAGASWTSYGLNLPNFSARALVWIDNGQDGLYLGMNYGIFYIDKNNAEWQPFSNNLPNVIISELEINYANNKIYAATYGRGLWVSDIFEDTLDTTDFDLNTLSIYPNPAFDSFKLNWNKNEPVTIRIFDALGKIMYYGKNKAISNELEIDISSFSTGIYYVRVNNTKGSLTKKLIKG